MVDVGLVMGNNDGFILVICGDDGDWNAWMDEHSDAALRSEISCCLVVIVIGLDRSFSFMVDGGGAR